MSHSILIIEDEPEVLKLLNRVLTPQGYEITEALGGTTALSLLQTTSPAVILLDLAMPDINGLELLAAIQTMPHLTNTKVLVITARTQMLEDARQFKVDAVFVKPVRPKHLINTIQTLL